MVLWEITLGTAYFLGLKRTYKLALRIQRRIIGPKHPKIRQFFHRRTRAVFDVALKVHKNIQERDIEVGRNLGNWILRCLDRMKPSAQIRGGPLPLKLPNNATSNMNATKQVTPSSHLKVPESTQTSGNKESDRHLFVASRNPWPKSFPTVAMMMRPPRPAGTLTQYRHVYSGGPEMPKPNYKVGSSTYEGVIRKDIFQYIFQN